jgi:GAF domain-containing protein
VDPARRPRTDAERKLLDDVRARDQLEVLLHVSRVLGHQGDQDPTDGLPDILVPAIGDWCSVDLLDGDELRRVAARHVDGDQRHREAELQAARPGWQAGLLEVARTGEAVLVFDVRELADDHHAVLAGLGMVSAAMVPIRTSDRVLGVLTVATGPDRRGPRPSDVAAYEELGRRVAFAIERIEVQEALLAARQQAAELEGARRIATTSATSSRGWSATPSWPSVGCWPANRLSTTSARSERPPRPPSASPGPPPRSRAIRGAPWPTRLR